MMQQYFEMLSKLVYGVIAVILMLLAFTLVALTFWNMVSELLGGKVHIFTILHNIGLIVVSVAIFDVGKLLLEEGVLRERELRSIREARHSLTKFMTIIIIAISLETLIIVFETKQEHIEQLLYPGVLLIWTVFALVVLGVFQWLSSKANTMQPWDAGVGRSEEKEAQVEPPGTD